MDAINIIESISIIIAALTLIIGVSAWRREYIGKRNFEIAEEVLSLFYEARDAIGDIRSPFAFGAEGSTRKTIPDETKEEKEIRDRAFVTVERYNRYRELFIKLYSMRYRYMARFGKDSIKPFVELQAIVNEIITSASLYSEAMIEQHKRIHIVNDQSDQSIENEMKEYREIIWSRGKKDKIDPKVEKIISEIEEQTQRILAPDFKNKVKQWFI